MHSEIHSNQETEKIESDGHESLSESEGEIEEVEKIESDEHIDDHEVEKSSKSRKDKSDNEEQ